MKNEIIIATRNKNKVKEFNQILSSLNYAFIPMEDKGIYDDIVEDGSTLEENALIKARYLYKKLKSDVMSEDTGLEINALDGEPGVHTARYAGEHRSAIDNMNLCLSKMEGIHDRQAQFRTVICLILKNVEYLFEGKVLGNVAHEILGNGGFGYDPIFIPEQYDHTFGQLSSEIKNKISHRKNALKELENFLKKQEQ